MSEWQKRWSDCIDAQTDLRYCWSLKKSDIETLRPAWKEPIWLSFFFFLSSFLSIWNMFCRRVRPGFTMVARISTKQLVRPGRSYLWDTYVSVVAVMMLESLTTWWELIDCDRYIIARFFFSFFSVFFVVVFVARRMNNVNVVTFTIIFDQDQSLIWLKIFVKQKIICLYWRN